MREIQKYYNPPQMDVFLASAFETYCEWGRGTGKSSGVIAPRIERLAFDMPRGNFGIVAKTYQQLMTRTLPGVIKGLAELGYYRDIDYTIGKFADAKWKWELPFAPPLRADYFMHWRTGAGFNFISQDQKGMAAGLSLDAIIGDEAKHLDQELYEEELLPANRGNRGYWDGTHKDPRVNNSLHHSILLCSDTPTNQSGRWFIEKEKEHTAEKINDLIRLEFTIQQLQAQLLKVSDRNGQKKLSQEINPLIRMARHIRRGDPERYRKATTKADRDRYKPSVYFSRANVFDNLDVLGEEYVDQQYRNLPYAIFRTSILNERANQVLHGFYPDLSDKQHGYDKFDNSHFTNIGYDFQSYEELDSRQDGDVDRDQPLDMAPDYGGHFNCIVLGQHQGSQYRLLNGMHVKSPKKIRDLVAEFKRYYRFHKRKEVNFFYDHTGKRTDPIHTTDFHKEYVNCLKAKDEYGSWKVNSIYCKHTPSYESRHEFWSKLLRGQVEHWPVFKYNRYHCEYWAISAMMAPLTTGRNGFEKGKKSEQQNSKGEYRTPQEEATHYSDAGDTLLYFRVKHYKKKRTTPTGAGILT